MPILENLMEEDFPIQVWTKFHKHFQLKPMFHKSGIILLNFDESCGLNILSKASTTSENQSSFTTNQFWLLVTQNSNAIFNLNNKDIFFPPDSEIRILIDNEMTRINNGYTLIDIYKISAIKDFQIKIISKNFHQLCEMFKDLNKFGSAISYRENLDKLTFQTGQVVPFPDQFTQIEDLNMHHVNTITKVHYRILQNLKEQLNIRYLIE